MLTLVPGQRFFLPTQLPAFPLLVPNANFSAFGECCFVTEHERCAFLCVQANSKQEVAVRRHSFTPMSSQDQVKRPRVFSVGNPPRTPLPPSLSSTDVPEAQENEELAENQVRFCALYVCLL